VDPADEVTPSHVNEIVKEVNRFRREALENEIMQEAADIPNIHLHLSSIGNVMSARDESSDPRPIMEHLKFLETTSNELAVNTSVMDESVARLSNVVLTADEHKGVSDLFTKYKPENTFAAFGKDIFLGIQAYLNPLTNCVTTWTTPRCVMKGLDDKVSEFEAKISKLTMDVTAATVVAAAV